tara:strand:- start:19243 stop:19755 length:513 start_codon:yes stop_codon:yes gene_type:complete
MLNALYEKTRIWGPGSCMVAFYFFSLIPIVCILFLSFNFTTLDLNSIVISDLKLLTNALLISPWAETLMFQVLLTKVFSIMKSRPTNIILAVAIIFSAYHYTNGVFYPFIVFIPALVFSWNYYLYYEKQEAVWGLLTTTVLHFLYNFTIFVMIPLINIVLTIYYNVDVLK